MNLKLVKLGVAILSASLTLPILLILVFYSPQNLNFCWNVDCLNFAVQYFKTPISVFVFCLSFISILVAASNLQNNTQALQQNFISSWSANSVAHFNEFHKLVKWESSKFDALDEKSFSIATLHSTLFPNLSILGDPSEVDFKSFSISKEAERELLELANITSVAHQEFGAGRNEFNFDAHKTLITLKLEKFGIKINQLPNDQYFEIESEMFQFLNKLLQTLGINDICFIEEPSYHAHQ